MLYPLTFHPILKERIWGGRALADLYRKPLPPRACVGESWEISDRLGDASVIANGPFAGRDLRWLMEQHGAAVMGHAANLNGRFPLLVKILDACKVLSVQVHPPAGVAAQLGGEPKAELWYVTKAVPGAELCAGLRAGVTRAEFERRLGDGTVAAGVHQVPVKAGDAMFLPSGRLHALGAGVVIFEIQQNSDTTYRVFDWNRVGNDGKHRALHVTQGLACIDFGDFEPGLIDAGWETVTGGRRRRLVKNSFFTVDEQETAATVQQTWTSDRPAILGVVAGQVGLIHPESGERLELRPGQFALLPAAANPVMVCPDAHSAWLTATCGDAA
jgi:mannose-6-phosphate isomerase